MMQTFLLEHYKILKNCTLKKTRLIKKNRDRANHQERTGLCNQDSRKIRNNPPKNMNLAEAESSWAQSGIGALSPVQSSPWACASPLPEKVLEDICFCKRLDPSNLKRCARDSPSSSILCFLLSDTGGPIFTAFLSAGITPQTQQEPKWSLKSLHQPLLARKGGTSTLFLASF